MAERTYEGEGVRVFWDSSRCIHTGRCLIADPEVYDLRRRPWIDVNAASADRIATTVELCPAGALRYERTDGAPQEAPPSPTRVIPAPDGPVVLRGDMRLETPEGELLSEETRLTLCRCGRSENQPYCDNAHRRTGFRAPGLTPDDSLEGPDDEQPAAPGATTLMPKTNGSLRLAGDMVLETPRGEVVARRSRISLCRCGQSANKPFCDGSHRDAGFTSEEPVLDEARATADSPEGYEANRQIDC